MPKKKSVILLSYLSDVDQWRADMIQNGPGIYYAKTREEAEAEARTYAPPGDVVVVTQIPDVPVSAPDVACPVSLFHLTCLAERLIMIGTWMYGTQKHCDVQLSLLRAEEGTVVGIVKDKRGAIRMSSILPPNTSCTFTVYDGIVVVTVKFPGRYKSQFVGHASTIFADATSSTLVYLESVGIQSIEHVVHVLRTFIRYGFAVGNCYDEVMQDIHRVPGGVDYEYPTEHTDSVRSRIMCSDWTPGNSSDPVGTVCNVVLYATDISEDHYIAVRHTEVSQENCKRPDFLQDPKDAAEAVKTLLEAYEKGQQN